MQRAAYDFKDRKWRGIKQIGPEPCGRSGPKICLGVGLLDNHVVLVAENELHTTLVHSEDAGDGDGFATLEDLRCDLQVSEF